MCECGKFEGKHAYWCDDMGDRSWQEADVVYEMPSGEAFYTPDGEGRIYYDCVYDAAVDLGGGLTVIALV